MSRIWTQNYKGSFELPPKDLDSWVLIAQAEWDAVKFIQDNFYIQGTKLSSQGVWKSAYVAPFDSPLDPFLLHIAKSSKDLRGLVYYEVIDLLEKRLGRFQSIEAINWNEFRQEALARRRVRNTNSTYIHPDPEGAIPCHRCLRMPEWDHARHLLMSSKSWSSQEASSLITGSLDLDMQTEPTWLSAGVPRDKTDGSRCTCRGKGSTAPHAKIQDLSWAANAAVTKKLGGSHERFTQRGKTVPKGHRNSTPGTSFKSSDPTFKPLFDASSAGPQKGKP